MIPSRSVRTSVQSHTWRRSELQGSSTHAAIEQGAVIMDKIRRAFRSGRASAARDPLRGAVRRALRLSTGVIAAGLALGVGPTASAAPFPAVFPLGSLAGGDGSTGFALNGIHASDESGRSVSAAGDGDAIDDVIIGAYHADSSGRIDAGTSYVVFGRDTAQAGNFPAAFEFSSLLPANGGDGSPGFVLNGIDSRDKSSVPPLARADHPGRAVRLPMRRHDEAFPPAVAPKAPSPRRARSLVPA
jgi:hypothetical protein